MSKAGARWRQREQEGLSAREIGQTRAMELFKKEAPEYPSTPKAEALGEGLWLVEEKLDGANCGVWLDEDGVARIRDRTRALRKGVQSEGWGKRQFEPLWERAARAAKAIKSMEKQAGMRLALYGEWMLIEHGCSYGQVDEPWRPFALWSIDGGKFLDPNLARELLVDHGFSPPMLLSAWSLADGWPAARQLAIGESELGGPREGAVFKRGDGAWMTGCAKIVRDGFEQGSRWSSETPVFHARGKRVKLEIKPVPKG